MKGGWVALVAILTVLAVAGWWQASTLSRRSDKAELSASELGVTVTRLRSEADLKSEQLEQADRTATRLRARVEKAGVDALDAQNCVSRIADQDRDGGQDIAFGFVEIDDHERGLRFDAATWYEETTSEGNPVPHDYRIRNASGSERALAVAFDAVVVTTTMDRHNIPSPKCLTWWGFLSASNSSEPWRSRIAHSPYWVTIQDGEVIRIVEQYLP